MKVTVQIARRRDEILRCQYAIAEVYNREYEVVFSDDRSDLDAKVEPWPHRYLMVLHEGELAATVGLYLRNTYVERYGRVERADLDRVLGEAGARDRHPVPRLREITKLVVPTAFRGRNLARFALACGHSRAFCLQESEEEQLITVCSKRSIVEGIYARVGLRTRHLRPFPLYKVHELYRSATDPMDSYVIVPHLDIPPRLYALELPGEFEVETVLEGLA